MKYQIKKFLLIILKIIFFFSLHISPKLVLAQQKHKSDFGFLISLGYSQSYAEDINSNDFKLPGIGLGVTFPTATHLVGDVYFWPNKKEYNGTHPLVGGGTTNEYKGTSEFMFILRLRQRVFSFLYVSIGGGLFEEAIHYSYSVLVENGKTGRPEDSHLVWSLGLDVQLGSKLMLGCQWMNIGNEVMYETANSGAKGLSFQATYIIPLYSLQ